MSRLLILLALLAPPAPAQITNMGEKAIKGSPQPFRVSSGGPLVWNIQGGKIFPVTGVDWSVHLSYRLFVVNVSAYPVEIKSFEVVDPDKGDQVQTANRVISANKTDVTGKIYRYSVPRADDDSSYSTTLGAGQSGAIFVDLTYPIGGVVPRNLSNRIVGVITAPSGAKVEYNVTDDPTAVSKKEAVVLTPPLRGDGWVDFSGCCLDVTAHRGSINAVDGRGFASEEFAIDFLRVRPNGTVITGNGSKSTDFYAYGAEIYCSAGGQVVEAVNNIPELPPGTLATATLEGAAGNRVIVDIGNGRYVLYAHMQQGSVTVRVGEQVTRGQKLGLLGTSGNSDAPHLHFQVMDGPNSLKSNALPFVFDRMDVQGRYDSSLNDFVDRAQNGSPVAFDLSQNGPVYERMPLTRWVMGFN